MTKQFAIPCFLFSVQFRTGLFPCLRGNDLLRPRRTGTWTKRYAEDYLREHPRSRKGLVIYSPQMLKGRAAADANANSRLIMMMASFLQQDESSSILMPINRLSLKRATYGYEMRRLLRAYGHQLVRVEVEEMKIPFTQTARNFFKQLPKLRSRVHKIITDETAILGPNSVTFPPSFKQLT